MVHSPAEILRIPLQLLVLQSFLISSSLAFFSTTTTAHFSRPLDKYTASYSSFLFGHQPCQQKDRRLVSLVSKKIITPNGINFHRKSTTKAFAMPMKDMQTSYEWLAKEKGGTVSDIDWFDFQSSKSTTVHDESSTDDEQRANFLGSTDTMPLYPLGACYLPTKTSTHVLNNVQRKNIRMALDLTNPKKYPKQHFCVTLCALDSNRFAKIGTVMHLKSIEKQYSDIEKSSLSRIVVTCQPVGLVEILDVSTPIEKLDDNGMEKDGDMYLVAKVRDYPPKEKLCKESSDGDKNIGTLKRLWGSYSFVRSMYVNDPEQRTATRELPPFAIEAVQQSLLSEWMSFSLDSETNESNNDVDVNNSIVASSEENDKEEEFWKLAESWQTLCNTVRQGHLSNLYSDINEVMIAAARAQGGPLKLPIKKENLPQQVQTQIETMEQNANENFISLGMDPCLDFQALISLQSWSDRADWLFSMVERERKRLSTKEKLLDKSMASYEEETIYGNKMNKRRHESGDESDMGFQ